MQNIRSVIVWILVMFYAWFGTGLLLEYNVGAITAIVIILCSTFIMSVLLEALFSYLDNAPKRKLIRERKKDDLVKAKYAKLELGFLQSNIHYEERNIKDTLNTVEILQNEYEAWEKIRDDVENKLSDITDDLEEQENILTYLVIKDPNVKSPQVVQEYSFIKCFDVEKSLQFKDDEIKVRSHFHINSDYLITELKINDDELFAD